MLRLFPERYSVAVGAGQLAILARPGFGRKEQKPHLALTDFAESSEDSWHAPFHALQSYFSNLNPEPRELNLVLSNRFFQFALVSWSDQLSGPEERESLARIQLETMYGKAVKDKVKIDDSGYGNPAIACALDGVFLGEVDAWARENRIRLCSFTPYFMLAFNRWRKQLNDESVFVVVEQHHCVMLHIRDDRPAGLRTFHAPSSAVAQLLEREMILLDVGEQAKVYFAGAKLDGSRLPKHWDAVHLESRDTSPGSDIAAMLEWEEI